MYRSKAVPLGDYARRAAATFAALTLITGMAACGDPNQPDGGSADGQQDAQAVCGYEENGEIIIIDRAQCDKDADADGLIDDDHDSSGRAIFFYHLPYGGTYPAGSRHPVSSSSHSVRPSAVGKGYGTSGAIKVGGFGSGAGTGGRAGGGGAGG